MNLEEMLQRQAEFEREFYDRDNMSVEERTEWVEKYVLHLHDQTTSMLRELPFKDHEEDEIVDYDALLTEIVDVQKYLLAVCVVMNVQPSELEAEFERRSTEVEERD